MDNESIANPIHFKLSLLKPKKSFKHNTNKNVSMKTLKKASDYLETKPNMEVLQKTMKRRKIKISERSRKDKEIDFLEKHAQHDQIIAKENIELEYNAINFESPEFNDEDSSKIFQSIVEQTKKDKSDSNKTITPKKCVKNVLYDSQSSFDHSLLYPDSLEMPITETDTVIDNRQEFSESHLENTEEQAGSCTVIDNGSELSKSHIDETFNETNLHDLKSEIDTLMDNGPDLYKSKLVESDSNNLQTESNSVINNEPDLLSSKLKVNPFKNGTPEFRNPTSYIDSTITGSSMLNYEKDLNDQSILRSISQSITDITDVDKYSGSSKLNDKNDTEKSKIKDEQRKPSNKTDSAMNNISETSSVDLNIFKPRTDVEIYTNFSRSNSIIGEKQEEPASIAVPRRNPRRKSIYKSLVEEDTKKSQRNVKQSNVSKHSASSLQKDKALIKKGLENGSDSEKHLGVILDDEPQTKGKPKSTGPKKKEYITKLKPHGKITKYSLRKTSHRKIPKNRLEDALEMFHNEDHPIWVDNNLSCNPGIQRYWDTKTPFVSGQNLKLKYARQFLLRRDWLNLSKVLSVSTLDTKQKTTYYPLLSKYAALCLAHTDKEQFSNFVQFLVGMDASSNPVIKKCTSIIQKTE